MPSPVTRNGPFRSTVTLMGLAGMGLAGIGSTGPAGFSDSLIETSKDLRRPHSFPRTAKGVKREVRSVALASDFCRRAEELPHGFPRLDPPLRLLALPAPAGGCVAFGRALVHLAAGREPRLARPGPPRGDRELGLAGPGVRRAGRPVRFLGSPPCDRHRARGRGPAPVRTRLFR